MPFKNKIQYIFI